MSHAPPLTDLEIDDILDAMLSFGASTAPSSEGQRHASEADENTRQESCVILRPHFGRPAR